MLRLTKEEKSWILYDVANSAFVLVVVTAVMPVFFKEFAAYGASAHTSTAYWGYANSASSALLVILSPVLGSLADFEGWKKRLLAIFIFSGAASTMLLFTIPRGAALYAAAIFIAARTAWGAANIFYDSMITDITEPARMDRVSTLGYAFGYIGSVIPFLAVIFLILSGKSPGDTGSIPEMSAKWGFVIVALWWLLLSIPILKNTKQKYSIATSANPFTESFRQLSKTLSHLAEYRQALTFLAAYFFFIDGVDTIITMAVAYGVDMGLSSSTLIAAILVIQIVAFPFSIFWGKMSDRYRVKPLIAAGIAVYVIITLLAFAMPSLPDLRLKQEMFWLLSILVATSMGGIQALSRSFFARLIPPEKSAEFFGFYNISGKFATITGPFLVAAASQLTGSSRFGVLSILILFIIGAILLSRVKEPLKS